MMARWFCSPFVWWVVGLALFIMAAGQGTCLAVLGPADAEPGLIAYEMAMLAKRIGQHLTVYPRPTANTEPAPPNQ